MSTLIDKISALRAEISGLQADLSETEYGTPEHRMLSDLIAEKEGEYLNLTEQGTKHQPATRSYYLGVPENKFSKL